MHIKTDYPRQVREFETWIPLSDGVRLSARIWLPTDAEDDPVPAILEYIPYRKDDGTAPRDALHHPYFAGHGYAAVRVDLRGSGDSDGIMLDEYLPQELEDGCEVIAWLAQQHWCTGKVGMIGKSWGGFNGLQIASRQPEALSAVITVCSTDDRYSDDVHYMGGCVLGSDMLSWASTMLAYNARPPEPRVVGDRWREMWLDRLEKTPPYIEAWLTHQRRDEFWKHGSVCEDWSKMTCPVYAIGGWEDGYSDAVFRLVENLPGPKKGLIGPWAHVYPHTGVPSPAVGFLQECLRWWDQWLKGKDTGIMDEPSLRVWMKDSADPDPNRTDWPGRWVEEPAWSASQVESSTHWLNDETLATSAGREKVLTLRGSQVTGIDSGVWCPFGMPAEIPPDQREEDGRSLTFTSDPVAETTEILGFPSVDLTLAVDKLQALVAVRLCDVTPDGASTLITHGTLNLTHRNSHETPEKLEPGKRYTVHVDLHGIAYAIKAGHRLRVSVSPTYWPQAWPSPEPVALSVFTGEASRLNLPVRKLHAADENLRPFERPEGSQPLDTKTFRAADRNRTVIRDLASGRTTLIDHQDGGRTKLIDTGTVMESITEDRYSIVEGDPLSATAESDRTIVLEREGWRTRVETASTMTSDRESFYVTNSVEAFEGNTRIFAKTWHFSVPRDHQ